MALELEVIRNVYVDCGNPPQRVLSLATVRVRIAKALRYYGVQAQLSDQNLSLKVSAPFTPTAKDIAIPQSWAFDDAAIAEILVDQTNDVWNPIAIVNKADIAVYEQSGAPAVAFYNTEQAGRMCFSWDPSLDGDSIRISYNERISDPATPDTAIFLPDYFAPMCAVRVAIDCIDDIIDKQPERAEILENRRAKLIGEKTEWEEQWEIRRFTSPGQGATKRLAFNRNRPGWRSGRWRR